MTPEERYSRFEQWLMAMPESLDAWREGLPRELAENLDFSLGSLDLLERWMLEEFPDARSAVGGDNFLIGDGAARYIGETYRRNFGGAWDMDVYDPNSIVFGTPSLRGFPKGGIPVAPLRLVANLLEERKKGYLSAIADNLA